MTLQEHTKGVGRRGLINVNFESGLQKTLLRTLSADNSSLIPKVACAWSGSPQPFRQMFGWRSLCWPSTCPNNFCLGKEGQQEERSWASPSVLNGRGVAAALRCADPRHRPGVNPHSIQKCPAVPHCLEPSLNLAEGWTLPHPRGQQSPRGRCVFVSAQVFARPGETTGRGVRAPRFRGKGEK